MPATDRGIREITEPVDFAIVGDRLHFVLHSGECARTYSISFHKARNAAMLAWILLKRTECGKVAPLSAIKGGRA